MNIDRSLDIAFFGSSIVSAYWNGAATYYRGIVRALHDRGHRITFYEPDAFERQQHRDLPDPEWCRVVVYPTDDASHPLAMLEQAGTADIIIKASGIGVFDALLEREVAGLRGGPRTVLWDVDAAATLESIAADPSHQLRRLIEDYDAVFTYGGGPPVVERYLALGAQQCVPIYNALDPASHYPVRRDARFECDLVFLGNRLPDRERRVEEFFLKAAELCPQRRFLLGGSGWQDKSLPGNVELLGHVYTRDHNALNSTPLAVLNISRDSMARLGHSPATRVFEAAGAAACIISDAWEGIEAFLAPDEEVLVACDGREVAEHLQQLDAAAARAIGARARKRMLAQHTYAHRAVQVEQALLDLCCVRSPRRRAGDLAANKAVVRANAATAESQRYE